MKICRRLFLTLLVSSTLAAQPATPSTRCRAIRQVGDPILRARAQEVLMFDERLQQLVEEMLATMYAAPGIGLAAPQVGVSQRVIVLDLGQGPICMANPRIVHRQGQQVGIETCLSIPDLYGEVERAQRVVVEGQDPQGRALRMEAEGLLARCFLHEIDHLDGVLFTDRALRLHKK